MVVSFGRVSTQILELAFRCAHDVHRADPPVAAGWEILCVWGIDIRQGWAEDLVQSI